MSRARFVNTEIDYPFTDSEGEDSILTLTFILTREYTVHYLMVRDEDGHVLDLNHDQTKDAIDYILDQSDESWFD